MEPPVVIQQRLPIAVGVRHVGHRAKKYRVRMPVNGIT